MTFYKRFFGHLSTVNKHRREVRKLMKLCGLRGGWRHDLSKYSPVEFWNGVKYYTGTASPHVGERKDKGYSDAWLHHKAHNKHHAEYWCDIVNGKTQPIDMPVDYFVEMICDRIAASNIYLGDKFTHSAPLQYYLSHRDENQFSENTATLLHIALTRYERLPEYLFWEWMRDLLANPNTAYCFIAL
jgi:hypothetical protein